MTWLALDIGGANIKAADGAGYARSYPFALWRQPERLGQQIRTAIAEAPACERLAVTMTGELADCFRSKAEGVQFILRAASSAADGRSMRVYLVDGRLVSPDEALAAPRLAAASNWHALARFAGRYAPQGPGLLIDVGSTTCDVIPLFDGRPAAQGMTDTQRLLSGELVYTGVERSPLCAVMHEAPYRGRSCPVAQELFATMQDVYLILGDLPEDKENRNTADGRPATRTCALRRLARMVAADEGEFTPSEALEMARAAAQAQTSRLVAAIRQVQKSLPERLLAIIVAGHGEFLARRALRQAGVGSPVVSVADQLGADVSRCGPACALAVLAREWAA